MTLLLNSTPFMATATGKDTSAVTASKVVIQDIKTTKGLTGWFVATPEIPVFTIALNFFEAGNASNPKGKSKLGDLLADLLDEGAGERNSLEFKTYLLENNINLSVSQSNRAFSISIRTTKDKAEEALKVIGDILKKPRLDEASIKLSIQQMLSSLNQSQHSEKEAAKDLAEEILFGDHPYNTQTLKAIKDIPTITVADMRGYLKSHCAKENLRFSIAGDITIEEAKRLLDQYLGDLPEKYAGNKVPDVTPKLDGKVTVKKMDIPQSQILFFQPGIARKDPDFYAAYILNKILGDGNFESRLWNEIREKRGLAYTIDTDLNWDDHTNYLSGNTGTENKNVKEVITLIREQWQKLLATGITQAELDFVKKRLMGSYPLGFASTMKIVGLMSSYQYDGLDPDFINARNAKIAAVTLEDINRVAKKLIQPDKLTFIIVGNPEGLDEDSRKKS